MRANGRSRVRPRCDFDRRRDRAGVLRGPDGGAELVNADQQGLDHLGCDRLPPDSERVDQLFEVVGDPTDPAETGHRRGALDRVKLAVDRPDDLLVTAGLLQLEQQLPELDDAAFRFLGEQPAQLV